MKTICDVNDLNSARVANEIEKQFGYKPQTVRNMHEVFDDRDIDAIYINSRSLACSGYYPCLSGR